MRPMLVARPSAIAVSDNHLQQLRTRSATFPGRLLHFWPNRHRANPGPIAPTSEIGDFVPRIVATIRSLHRRILTRAIRVRCLFALLARPFDRQKSAEFRGYDHGLSAPIAPPAHPRPAGERLTALKVTRHLYLSRPSVGLKDIVTNAVLTNLGLGDQRGLTI